jgi:hypothetical protein
LRPRSGQYPLAGQYVGALYRYFFQSLVISNKAKSIPQQPAFDKESPPLGEPESHYRQIPMSGSVVMFHSGILSLKSKRVVNSLFA